MPEQDVAHRATAERRHAAEQADADPVHAAAPGGERRRHGLDDNGDKVQSVKQHDLCAPARGRGRTASAEPPRRRLRRESDRHEARLKGVRDLPASLDSIVRTYQSINWTTPPS